MSFSHLSRAVLSSGLILITCASQAFAIDKIKVSFAAFSANYMPYHLAIDKGYFRDEGLDVEIVNAAGGVATPALIAGDLAFSTSGSSAISPAMRGAGLKVLLVLFDRPGFQVWTTRDEVKSLADLKGKTLGIQSRGDTFEISARIAFKSLGMDPNSVGFTPLGFGADTRMAAIRTGSLGAVMIAMDDTHKLLESGALSKSRMLADFFQTVRIPFTASATTDKLMREKPAMVKSFVRAVIKGMHYMRTYRSETVTLMMQLRNKLEKSDVSRGLSEKEYDAIVQSLTTDGTVAEAIGMADAESRAGIMNISADKIPPFSKLYDFSVANSVNKELAASGWKPAR